MSKEKDMERVNSSMLMVLSMMESLTRIDYRVKVSSHTQMVTHMMETG